MATLGNKARAAREKAQRRINTLKESTKSSYFSQEEKESMKANIKELQRAMNATRNYTKTGRKIKNRTAETREAAIKRLNELVKEQKTTVEYKREINRRKDVVKKNEITKQQLNLASLKSSKEMEKAGTQVGKYTSNEVSRFYNATRKYWENAEEHMRNEAILKGLGMESLEEAVDYVLKNTQKQKDLIEKIRNGYSYDEMTDEEREYYDNLVRGDSEDEEKPSPPYEM